MKSYCCCSLWPSSSQTWSTKLSDLSLEELPYLLAVSMLLEHIWSFFPFWGFSCGWPWGTACFGFGLLSLTFLVPLDSPASLVDHGFGSSLPLLIVFSANLLAFGCLGPCLHGQCPTLPASLAGHRGWSSASGCCRSGQAWQINNSRGCGNIHVDLLLVWVSRPLGCNNGSF